MSGMIQYYIDLNARLSFSLNLVLKYVRPSEFAYEVLRWTMPNEIALNRAKPKACIATSHVKSLLFWAIMQHRGVIPDVLGWPIALISTHQKIQERTQRHWSYLTQSFLGDSVPLFLFFRQRSSKPGVPLRLIYSQSLHTTETVTC
jgi:hypothetical protein